MKLINSLLSVIRLRSRDSLMVNSLWGILSNIAQNILFSLFFIILARVYSRSDFANYIIANALYGMLVSLSSLGLAQWFIRERATVKNQKEFTDQFFKLQFLLGIFFYLLHVSVAFLLYDDQLIRGLSLLLGINIIFDNVIYVIKHVNIAEENQKKTFTILSIEAVIKFMIGLILLFYIFPIIYLSLLLILVRLITLNLFLHYGTSGQLSIKSMLKVRTSLRTVIQLIQQNWSFVIIGSLSVIYWRIGNIFVSKLLTVDDVSDYEVSFKLFSMAEILPFIVSTSLFPILVKAFQKGTLDIQRTFKKFFYLYALYGLMAYTFVVSYSGILLPFLFGDAYIDTSIYCNQMFLTILVFPTALLQANLLVSMKQEKIDMWLNLISLCVHVLLSLVGLYYFNSLSVICYSIFISFLLFHLLQDIILIRKGVMSLSHCLLFYLGTSLCLIFYYLLSSWIDMRFLYPIFWIVVFMLIVYILFYFNKSKYFSIRTSFSK